MIDDVITRMRVVYMRELGPDWEVTLNEKVDWDFNLLCKKDGFQKISIYLEPYKSVKELTLLAGLDCANILTEYDVKREQTT